MSAIENEFGFVGVFALMGILLGAQASHYWQHQQSMGSVPFSYLRYAATILSMIALAAVAGRIDKNSQIDSWVVGVAIAVAIIGSGVAFRVANRISKSVRLQ